MVIEKVKAAPNRPMQTISRSAGPGAGSAAQVLALQRQAGNRATQAALTSPLPVQRLRNPFASLFGRKRSEPEGEAKDEVNKVYERTGEIPHDAQPLLTVKLGVYTNTATRGNASTLSEYLGGLSGHAWVEIGIPRSIGSYQDLTAEEGGRDAVSTAGGRTQQELRAHGATSVGFYPAELGALTKKGLLKQIFVDWPGEASEPEADKYLENSRGSKTYLISDPEQAKKLFSFIEANRSHAYNLLKYNCTDWAVDAIKAAGLQPPGGIQTKAHNTSPNRLYRRIYQGMQLDDRSAQVSDLKNATKDGRRYDTSHIEARGEKKLARRRAAMLWRGNQVDDLPAARKPFDATQAPQQEVQNVLGAISPSAVSAMRRDFWMAVEGGDVDHDDLRALDEVGRDALAAAIGMTRTTLDGHLKHLDPPAADPAPRAPSSEGPAPQDPTSEGPSPQDPTSEVTEPESEFDGTFIEDFDDKAEESVL